MSFYTCCAETNPTSTTSGRIKLHAVRNKNYIAIKRYMRGMENFCTLSASDIARSLIGNVSDGMTRTGSLSSRDVKNSVGALSLSFFLYRNEITYTLRCIFFCFRIATPFFRRFKNTNRTHGSGREASIFPLPRHIGVTAYVCKLRFSRYIANARAITRGVLFFLFEWKQVASKPHNLRIRARRTPITVIRTRY